MNDRTKADAQFAAEYEANAAMYQGRGISQESYITSRRRDAGLEGIPFAAAAPPPPPVDPRIADVTSDPIAPSNRADVVE